MVFEVPGRIVADDAEGLFAADGVEALALPLLRRERGEPLGVPAPEGVDDGDVARDGVEGPGVPATLELGAVQAGIDERVFVPCRVHGILLSGGSTHAVDEGQLGVGEVAEQDPDGPSADARLGEKRGIELFWPEVEHPAVKVLDAAAVAGQQLGIGHGDEGLKLGLWGENWGGGHGQRYTRCGGGAGYAPV